MKKNNGYAECSDRTFTLLRQYIIVRSAAMNPDIIFLKVSI
jgi:hypothetical protein